MIGTRLGSYEITVLAYGTHGDLAPRTGLGTRAGRRRSRMSRVALVSALVALMGVSTTAQDPQAPLFAFASPDAAAGGRP